jgi:hypothetical protein
MYISYIEYRIYIAFRSSSAFIKIKNQNQAQNFPRDTHVTMQQGTSLSLPKYMITILIQHI